MASTYKGLFVQRDSQGQIDTVQVVDPSGSSIPLPAETYLQRGVKPPIETLPDEKQYLSQQKL